MKPLLFISDLHLCAERPETTALFGRFMRDIVPDGAALYILGDLFEAWVGDDQLDHDPLAREVAGLLSRAGCPVHLMHGNRDFLIGTRFAGEAGAVLLADPHALELAGRPGLLLHGDTLCTDDTAYQQFRVQVRSPSWQAAVLARPYDERIALATSIRSKSDVEKSMKAEAIMDVNAAAVEAAFRAHGATRMIHGHTHRPARHPLAVDGRACERWVLPDWHATGGYLAVGEDVMAHTLR